MATPIDRAKAVADELKAATGLRVTLDPRNANPPSVLILPPRVQFNRGCGGTAEWTAIVMAAGPGNADAWSKLDQMVAAIVAELPIETAEPDSYRTDQTADLPAYRLRWEEGVEFAP